VISRDVHDGLPVWVMRFALLMGLVKAAKEGEEVSQE
jgi:hypothetical protein